MKKFTFLLVIGLFLFINYTNSQTWTTYTKEDGLASEGAWSVAIDTQGNKWFGTNEGVSKFDGTTWTTYNTFAGLASDYVGKIAIDAQGNKWFRTIGGVSKFNDTTWTTYTLPVGIGVPGALINDIVIDAQGNKWFASDGAGLVKFDDTNWTSYPSAGSIPCGEGWAIAIDAQGNIWYVCDACDGWLWGPGPNYLIKFDGTTWTPYTTDSLFCNWIDALAIDAQGNKWLGTENIGVLKFDGTNWTNYTTADGLVNNCINDIAIDAQDNKWFGTIGGVSKFDGTNWTTYITENGWENNYIYDIAIDAQGNKWFGTFGGVSKLDERIIAYISTSPDNQNVGYQTRNTTFKITSNINWTISDDADWLTVNPTSGVDNRTITVNFNANTLASSRVATIIITGSGKSDTVTVTQGIKILWGLPDNLDLSYEDRDSTFIITSNIDWTISDDADWLTVSPISGSGNDTITVNFTENTSTSPRVAIITIYGPGINTQYLTVTQGIKKLTVLPNNLEVSYMAGTSTFIITSNIDWTISEDADWLTISQTSGSGNDNITINLEANTLLSSRVANIKIFGTGVDSQIVIVSQAGIIKRLSVLPDNWLNIRSEAGDTTFYITSNIEYTISDNVDWLTVSPTSSSGNDTITVHFEANTSLIFAKNATITITGTGVKSQTVNITQAPIKILTVLPNNLEVCSEAGDTNLIITSNTSWAVSYEADWLTVSSSSGIGNYTITINLEANYSTSPRVATITISGKGVDSQTITVTQAGFVSAPSLYDLNVTIYPNPVEDYLFIEFDDKTLTDIKVSVVDILGRSLIDRNFEHIDLDAEETLDLSFMKSGLYFLEIRSERNSKVYKIIKE
jgi:sugar lactone lactonase YvrE